MPPIEAGIRREGDALVFAGTLDRAAVAGLWPSASSVSAAVRRLDLRAVDRVDSAGLALLAELAARLGPVSEVVGDPVGLAELRAAYRLTPTLAFDT